MNVMVVVVLVMKVIVMMVAVFYLSDQQNQGKRGRRQLPQPHDRHAPFPSFLSLTRSLLFRRIEAPGGNQAT